MRERFKLFEQELGHKIWTIVQLFYRSHAVFREQFESYEKKVLDFAVRSGIDRASLRLNSSELAGLLDLKSMERLRDGYIHELKDLCHLVFRGKDRTDLLDRYVSDIFHEISILKEEHYNVKTYAPLYERDSNEVELKHILDEAHTLFPLKLRHIRYLFGRAQGRLEEHLASFSNIQLFIRSLYLHRNDFIAEAYPGGLTHFYQLMYPLGPLEGYYQAGLSFYFAGFFDEALESFRLAQAAYCDGLNVSGYWADNRIQNRLQVHDLVTALESKITRLAAKGFGRAGFTSAVSTLNGRASGRRPAEGEAAGKDSSPREVGAV